MYPSKELAEQELNIAGEYNPGPWVSNFALESIERVCDCYIRQKT